MYDIGLDKPKKKRVTVKAPTSGKAFKANKPLIAAIIVNVLVYIITAFVPEAMMLLAIGADSPLGLATAYTFNFTHAGLFHLVMNMLVLLVFAEQIQGKFFFKKWVQWFLYFGMPAIIGAILLMVGTPPTVGYSGVALGILAFGIYFKMTGYKSIAIQLVLFHIIAFFVADVWLGINISFIGHLVGAVVGWAFAWLINNSKKYHTWKYKKSKKNSNIDWRERHGKI